VTQTRIADPSTLLSSSSDSMQRRGAPPPAGPAAFALRFELVK
jgi:hypothetical protein